MGTLLFVKTMMMLIVRYYISHIGRFKNDHNRYISDEYHDRHLDDDDKIGNAKMLMMTVVIDNRL